MRALGREQQNPENELLRSRPAKFDATLSLKAYSLEIDITSNEHELRLRYSE